MFHGNKNSSEDTIPDEYFLYHCASNYNTDSYRSNCIDLLSVQWVRDDWCQPQYRRTPWFHDRTRLFGNSTWKADFRLQCELDEKSVSSPKFVIVVVDIFPNAPASILHVCDDELLRMEAKQENTMLWDKTEDKHLINFANYKPPGCCDEQFNPHNAAKNLDEKSNTYWKEELTIPEEYSAHWHKCIHMLIQFESMWDGLLDSIKAVQPQMELDKAESLPINSFSYRVEGRAGELQKQESTECSPWTSWCLPRMKGHDWLCSSLRKTAHLPSSSIIWN